MRSLKKTGALLLSALMLTCITGCNGKDASSAGEPEKPADNTPFGKYVSNTFIATGNNQSVSAADGVTYRAFLPVEAYGEFEYCFYFSNTVDSTWNDGKHSYVGKQGSEYKITAASVAVATQYEATSAVSNETAVTFDGNATKTVAPGETFWSDPLTFTVPEGSYLVWTWTVQGEDLPAIAMSELAPTYYNNGSGFIYNNTIPLPQLIGCNRPVKKRIVTLGDSITQGCQTTQYGNAFWAANIAKELGTDYSLWNLGLGHARASDCAANGDWLQRAAHADIVIVAFGTNDMVSGQYGVGSPNAASSIVSWIQYITATLQNAGCQVIVFNAPPFDYRELQEGIRTELNTLLPDAVAQWGANYFDFASLLSDPSAPAKALYGGHPNDEGCKIVSDAFLAQYKELITQ
ncbi:MAG: SGNH/GDSL hydrolase family protein [Ruminococcus sp.]|nr:SGNH/GDSL hydrolase family protein [Ruminococcus sp.]